MDALVARAHVQTARIASPVPRETFDPPYADQLSRTLNRARRGANAANDLATAYYLYNCYFEEMLGFAGANLRDGTPAHRGAALALLGGDWMDGLRARMAQCRYAAGKG